MLVKENVRLAGEEVERKQKSLDSHLAMELNANQVAILKEEIARSRENLSCKLEEEYANLLEASKAADKVRVVQEKAGALSKVNENLDKALGVLLSKVPAESGAVGTESVTWG